jgi:enamine deaminase RidA (YjgF/YER057c/UK114 family)
MHRLRPAASRAAIAGRYWWCAGADAFGKATTATGSCTIFPQHRRCIHIEKRLEELGIVLPPAPTPKANYNIVCYTNDNVLYVSGHLPLQPDGTLLKGRIGPSSSGGESIEHGYQAARHAGLNIISTLKHQLGDLDRVQQIIKVRTEGRKF